MSSATQWTVCRDTMVPAALPKAIMSCFRRIYTNARGLFKKDSVHYYLRVKKLEISCCRLRLLWNLRTASWKSTL